MRAHLQDCPECRAYFDELAEADSWLRTGDEPEPQHHSAATFEARYSLAVMRSVDFQAARLAPTPPPEATPLPALERFGRWLRAAWAPALAAGAALAMMLWLSPWATEPTPEETWTPRGAATDDATPTRLQALEIFCVEHHGESVRFHEAEGGSLTCGEDEELKFGLINAAAKGQATWSHLTLVGRSEQGELRWYLPAAPVHADSPSMRVTSAERLRPLGETIRLSVHHAADEVIEVSAIFSDAPLPRGALSARLLAGEELRGMEVDGAVLGSPQRRYAVVRKRLVVQRSDHRTP